MSEESMAPSAEAAPAASASLALSGESAPAVAAPEATQPLATTTEAAPATNEKWWTGKVDEEHVGMMENKNFSDLNAAMKSLKNLEGMKGVPENELLRIAKSEDADGMGKMYDRLGRPETAADYKFDGVETDTTADWFRESAYKNGMNETQATQVFKDFNVAVEEAQASANEVAQRESQLAMGELEKEWGAAFQAQSEVAKNAAQRFGVTQEQFIALEGSMGTKELMNFMHKIGAATSEGSLVDAKSNPTDGSTVMTPAAAKDASAALMKDPAFKDRYFSKDPLIRKAAMHQRHVLNQLAAGKTA